MLTVTTPANLTSGGNTIPFSQISWTSTGNGDAGDVIRVEVTPNDGTADGATASDTATVQAASGATLRDVLNDYFRDNERARGYVLDGFGGIHPFGIGSGSGPADTRPGAELIRSTATSGITNASATSSVVSAGTRSCRQPGVAVRARSCSGHSDTPTITAQPSAGRNGDTIHSDASASSPAAINAARFCPGAHSAAAAST